MFIGSFFRNTYAFAVARAPAPLARLLRAKTQGRRLATPAKKRARKVHQGRDVTKVDITWYRGEHTNYNPTTINLYEKGAIEKYILSGWTPGAAFVSKSTPVVAFGSCFAEHVSRYLSRRGFNILGNNLDRDAYIVRCREGIVNTFAIRQQFEWAFEGREFQEGLWRDKTGQMLRPEDAVRNQTLRIFQSAEVFILTLGLSEVWYDKVTNDVFWRALPTDSFDPSRHGFRVSTVAENLENLRAIVDLIQRHRPEAKTIFTLSPVPLLATFRPVSCVSASSVSKAVLRVAIDELMRERPEDQRLFYFPSYEIVTSYFRDAYRLDNHHVRSDVIETIMETFVRHYVLPPSADRAPARTGHSAREPEAAASLGARV